MHLALIFFAIFSLETSNALAMDAENQWIYETTYSGCKNKDFINLHSIEVLKNSFGQSFDTYGRFMSGHEDAFLVYKDAKGITPELKRFLDSEGFYLALNKCFGQDRKTQDFYVAILIFVWDLLPRSFTAILATRSIIASKWIRWYTALLVILRLSGSAKNNNVNSFNIFGKYSSILYSQELFIKNEIIQAKKENNQDKVNSLEQTLLNLQKLHNN